MQEGITRIAGVLKNKYCTEFLIKGSNLNADQIRQAIESKGDSVLVVGDEQVVKVHIHTDHPGQVLEYCGQLGDLTEIAIDNMKLQNEMITDDKLQQNNNVVSFPLNKVNQTATHNGKTKPIGIVAVVPGDGLSEIFTSLGVDYVIHGGQTMNPSTEEIVHAVEQINAEAVIILPNNKNVIFSAQQAKDLCAKRVEVVATRTIPRE